MLPDGLVGQGGGVALCREVMNMVDVAQAADPRPHDIHPLTPHGHDTGTNLSETCREACDKWGIMGPPWTGPTSHGSLPLTHSWASTPGVCA